MLKFNVRNFLISSLKKPTISASDSRLSKKIDELDLSVRSKNCLKNANIKYIGDLIQKSEDDLMQISGFGYTCLCEIKKMLHSLDLSLGVLVPEWDSSYIDALQNQSDNPLLIQATDSRLLKHVDELELSVRANNCLRNANINWLGELVQKREIDLLKTTNFGRKSLNEIKEQLEILNLTLGMKVLGWPPENLAELAKQQLFCDDVSLEDSIKEINNYVENKFTDIEKTIYHQRISQIHGATLQALADSIGVTRERVRQIERKAINNLLRIFYKNIASINNLFAQFGSIIDYSVNENNKNIDLIRKHSELLYALLSVHSRTHGTYEIDLKKRWLYKVEDLPEVDIIGSNRDSMDELIEHISQILSNVLKNDTPDAKQNFNSVLNKYVKQVIFDNFIFIDGKRTENNKNAVFHRFLSQPQYSKEPVDIAVLFEEYATFLERNNIDSKKYGYPKYTTFSNMVMERKDVLLSLGHKVRYYNYDNFNLKKLINYLNLNDYDNLEISCNKIFDENRELMLDYNILSAYELHNLLKKHCNNEVADFSRMPIIKFGRANRERQVLNFARTIAPIKLTDLASAYEESFGIPQNSFMANYIQCLRDYTYRGVVVFDDAKNISEQEKTAILSILTKDFYFIHEVEKLFKDVFGDNYHKYMHQSVLKSLGFYMAPQYILSEKYSSLREYINNKFDNMSIIDMEVYKEYRALGAFENWFYSKRNNSNLIKISDNKYISSSALVKVGITEGTIKEYIKQVLSCVKNKFFTIYSLSESACHFDLEDFGFENVFYEDLIMKYADVAFTKINNVTLFKNTSEQISFAYFISSLMEHVRIINIYDLMVRLEDEYGLIVSKRDLTRLVDETDLYYNNITENLYVTYDEFITSF